MDFRVDLNIFRGPLDLLLFLVKRHEVEITEIPITTITGQFLEYLSILEKLDLGLVGDFVATASLLMEIKSRELLPHADEVEEEIEDPRKELVQKLLAYKKYRDAAVILEEQGQSWQQHYPRQACDLPPRERNLAAEPIREAELWDLVSAFGRIIKDSNTTQQSSIVYDDTPIHVFMDQIHQKLLKEGRLCFSGLFEAGMHKSTKLGLFLATLELVRNYNVWVEQSDLFSEVWILPSPDHNEPIQFDSAELYSNPA
jgi:segregation and condensation protein A